MRGLMICLLMTLLFAYSPCRGAEKHPTREGKRATVKKADNSIPGLTKSLYYEFLQNGRIDFFSCLNRVDPADYHLWVGLARPKGYSDLEQRLTRTLDPLTGYPGGQMLCDAVKVGMEFYTFSQDITTYGNRTFHTGYSLKNTMGSSFKTGFFLNF